MNKTYGYKNVRKRRFCCEGKNLFLSYNINLYDQQINQY